MHNMRQRQGCRTAEKNMEGSLGVGRTSVVIILIAHQCQGARRDLVGRAPMDERVLAAVGDPHLFGRDLADRGGKLVPIGVVGEDQRQLDVRSEEHTSELQSLMRISYAVFCLKKKKHYDKE